MATKPPPHWDADSPELHANLKKVAASIRADVRKRVLPKVSTAKAWQKATMQGLAVPNPRFVGRFRGEPGLERCGVKVGNLPGTVPWKVAEELATFERRLQATVGSLDEQYPDAESLDVDGMNAVIELAAWAHAEWVRIHPFANGNGRTARLWANLLLMRYGLRPVMRLRPRPDGAYGDAGVAAMKGGWKPMVGVIRKMLKDAAKAPSAG